ncbi:MAG TPA: class I SAM-dependent methyltransferase [Pyrinomonadaceae bacterium]|jgi:2-polyprenyl-3-methyl-5-hydroxy-6-metoxy-1,4-benzoquinol methylase|nr:class I SAM-dependent methyltransferase [Pyrinomonadaceae bacterium]
MSTQVLEQSSKSRAELFAEKMLGAINGSAVALMTSIGHRTGLFDVMAALPPSSPARIAEAAGLNERYVREWLGAMTTGLVVEYDPGANTYSLPTEHAAFLTRAATPNNLAVTAQFVSILGAVEDRIVECFRHGGGVPYAAFGRFHQVMADESEQTVVAGLLDSILPLAPGLAEALRAGGDVLDVGCGSGRALNRLARAFPSSRFTGYDFSEEAVSAARREAERQGLTNVRFEARDVTRLGESEEYDLITAFDAIHDQAQPALVLRGISEALRPGGTFLMQDIRGSRHVEKNLDHPVAPFLYTISAMHCMTVSLAAGGQGLGTMWGEETAVEMLAEAGFRRVEVRQLAHDFMNNFYIARKN